MSNSTEATATPVYVSPTRKEQARVAPRIAQWIMRGKTLAFHCAGWVRERGWSWLRHQLVEIGREIRRAAQPPVKVRQHGKAALTISTRPEFGNNIVIVPLGGNAVVSVGHAAISIAASDGRVSGSVEDIVRVFSEAIESSGKRDVWQSSALNFTSIYVAAIMEVYETDGVPLYINSFRPPSFTSFYVLLHDERVTDATRRGLALFLEGIPGYKADKGDSQSSTFLEQYAYQQMHLRHAFNAIERRVQGKTGSHEVQVRASEPDGQRRVWTVGRFPDRETAEQAIEIIRKPLTGGTWGKWLVRLLVLWFLLILLRAWFAQPVGASGAIAASPGSGVAPTAVDPSAAALMGLFGDAGGNSTGNMPSALAAALDGSAAKSGDSGSLADEIYNEAMAKAKASMHEQGPPQSPAPDTGLKGFGLSGGASGAGCDPKLAFKVSP